MKLIRLALNLLILFTLAPLHAAENVVNVYNWSGYIPDNVLRQFQKETGIRINYATYESNETLYAKLKVSENAGYDVVFPSSYFVERMARQKLLQPLDKSKLENIGNFNPAFLNKEFDPGNRYSLPFLYSITGIIVNTRYIPLAKIKGWEDLWDPAYKDKLLLLDDPRELFSIALMSLGYSGQDIDPQHLKQAYEKLTKLMANVKLFNSDAVKTLFIDEEVILGMGWSGDLYFAQLENPNLHFIYPKEGFIVGLDNIAIPIGARHIDNAYKFINFITRADIGAEIALGSGFATTNEAAIKLLPDSVRNNKTVYPGQDLLKHAVIQSDAGSTSVVFEKYYQQLKLNS